MNTSSRLNDHLWRPRCEVDTTCIHPKSSQMVVKSRLINAFHHFPIASIYRSINQSIFLSIYLSVNVCVCVHQERERERERYIYIYYIYLDTQKNEFFCPYRFGHFFCPLRSFFQIRPCSASIPLLTG